jgi:phenylpyruvate tautomerase PptA (4-oxalocrotonate tautomerase family)
MDITLPQGTFTPTQKASIAHDLSHSLVKWEGREGNARSLGGTWVFFNEVSAENYAVGGVLQTETVRYRIFVTVPQGALTDEAKNGLTADVTRILLEAEGAPVDFANSARIYCLMNEVPDGNWGMLGRILRRADFAALLAAPG